MCGTKAVEENSEEQTRQLAIRQESVTDQGPTRQTEIAAGKPSGSSSAGPETLGQRDSRVRDLKKARILGQSGSIR